MITSEEAERFLAGCRLAGDHPSDLQLLRTEVSGVVLHRSGTSATYEITFGDGSRASFKPIEGVERSAAAWGHTAASVILNDLASWLVARGLGFETLLRGVIISTCPEPDVGLGSMQSWLDGQPSGPGWETASQLRSAALFDCVTGQQDRNGGNFVYDDATDELGLFDQSFTFPLHGHNQGASEIVNRVHSDGNAQLDTDLVAALDRFEASAERASLRDVLATDRYARMETRIALMRQRGELLKGGEY